ncbi:MAG: Formate dehydrogenase accessory protein [Rhodocyclaceae bacterium]|nr:Formate dehydrogenase accessory protein [Rhodocyclaceae bacterium]
MQTETIAFKPPVQEIASILLPVKGSVFADRADRFATLAQGHSLADWLVFLGELSQAQHQALQVLPELPLPDAAALEQARRHHMPPLNFSALPRPTAWQDVLRGLAATVTPAAPAAARPILAALMTASGPRLEQLADTLLKGEPASQDAAELCIAAAALQVVWTALAAQLDASTLGPLDTPGVCPCCGSLPVASIVRLSPTVNNLRYLHCSLCNTEWNLSRTVCSACGSDKDIAYQQIEGTEMKSAAAVRAETCDSCKSYLKICYQEKDPRVDPVADDLATLALDLLVDEAGFRRSGPNLLLIGGDGD